MSVISRNPFDLLADGDSPAPAPAPAAAKSTSTPAAKPARDIPGSKAPQQKSDDKPSSGAGRGRGGYYNRGGPRNVLKSNADKPTPESEVTIVEPEQGFDGERRAPSKNERGQARPRGHGEGAGRGRATRTRGRGSYGGPAGPGFTGGERRNDGRRSAHALPDSDKKIAQGWGADDGKAELTAEVEGAVDATKELAEPQTPAAEGDAAGWGAEVDTTGAKVDGAAAGAEEAAKPVEEEDNTKSYEEYLAERTKAALGSGLGRLEGRQVEGTSDFVGSALKKEEDKSFFGGSKKDKADAAAEKAKKEKKEKVFLEVEGRFAPPSRGDRPERGGRGGRGGFRGGNDRPARGGAGRGGRGGNRNAGNAPAVAVDDATAFPALS